MRKLEDHEKEEVKRLFDSKGFKIMEKLVEEFKVDIFNDMINKSVADNIELITAKQNKYLGIKTFIEKIRSSTKSVGKKKD